MRYSGISLGHLLLIVLVLFAGAAKINAQIGNSIEGRVVGAENRPIYDANVELMDDLRRTLNRTRTDVSGRYAFHGLSAGVFMVRVMPLEPEYEEQEQTTQIQVISQTTSQNESSIAGSYRENLDFKLKIKRGFTGMTGTVFVQDVPPQARKLFEKAVEDLNAKREAEGLAGLKAAIEAFPKYYLALNRLGIEYLRLKHYQAAQILLALAAEVNPRNYRTQYALAYCYQQMGLIDDAILAIGKSLESFPLNAESLLLEGKLFREKKRFAEAEKDLLKAKAESKDSMPEVNLQLGLLYANDLKKYRDAIRELNTFLKNPTKNVDVEKVKKMIADLESKASAT